MSYVKTADLGQKCDRQAVFRLKNDSTTNGTQAIRIASECHGVLIGAYLNFSALADWLNGQERDVIILCAGWKTKFNLEDSLFAGALAEKLLGAGMYHTICDSTLASIDLWDKARTDLPGYINKVAQKERLRKNKLDDVMGYCHTFDTTRVIPALDGDQLKNL